MKNNSFYPAKHKRGRQIKTLLISYTLAAFAVAGGFIYQNYLITETYKRVVTNTYRHAFSELVTDVNKLDETLEKSLHSGTNGLATETFIEIFGAAAVAKQSLGELPDSSREFEKTSGFITRVGDYAFTLAKKTARDNKLSEDEYNTLKSISETASAISGNLTEMLAEVNDGRINLGDLDTISRRASEKSDAAVGGAFLEHVKNAETAFPDMPEMIYDGPFSSHINGMKPKFLEGKPDVSREVAKKTAEEFTGYSGIQFDSERGGSLPVYVFTSTESENASIEVSKAGGVVVNVYASPETGEPAMSMDEAVQKAREYLEKHGYGGMRESYRMKTDGVCSVTFTSEKNGVILYPDLIKIDVAMDTGKIVCFRAQAYVMHAHERTLPAVAVSEEDARAELSTHLTPQSHNMAVIPTGGENEVLCHEFLCTNSDERKYLVYINAETGSEEKILMLRESENGTLAV